MNSINVQKRWKRPQLTVLVRNQAQEQILSACKGTGAGAGPDGASYITCVGRTSMACGGCFDISIS